MAGIGLAVVLAACGDGGSGDKSPIDRAAQPDPTTTSPVQSKLVIRPLSESEANAACKSVLRAWDSVGLIPEPESIESYDDADAGFVAEPRDQPPSPETWIESFRCNASASTPEVVVRQGPSWACPANDDAVELDPPFEPLTAGRSIPGLGTRARFYPDDDDRPYGAVAYGEGLCLVIRTFGEEADFVKAAKASLNVPAVRSPAE